MLQPNTLYGIISSSIAPLYFFALSFPKITLSLYVNEGSSFKVDGSDLNQSLQKRHRLD